MEIEYQRREDDVSKKNWKYFFISFTIVACVALVSGLVFLAVQSFSTNTTNETTTSANLFVKNTTEASPTKAPPPPPPQTTTTASEPATTTTANKDNPIPSPD